MSTKKDYRIRGLKLLYQEYKSRWKEAKAVWKAHGTFKNYYLRLHWAERCACVRSELSRQRSKK